MVTYKFSLLNILITFQANSFLPKALQSWNLAWEILHDDEDWRKVAGEDLKSGYVETKSYDGFGSVSRLKVSL